MLTLNHEGLEDVMLLIVLLLERGWLAKIAPREGVLRAHLDGLVIWLTKNAYCSV